MAATRFGLRSFKVSRGVCW